MSDQEYWQVSCDEIDEQDLDAAMIAEINGDFHEEEQEEETGQKRYSLPFRMVGLITLVVFMLFGAGYWFKELNLPPFNLIAQSQKLSNNQKIQELQKAVVQVNALQGQGTGFNIKSTGLIITNNHVINGAETVYVKFKDGSIFQVSKITAFPKIDIAVLKIPGSGLPVVELADDEQLKAREDVLIIGNPLGITRIVDEGKILGTIKLKDWEESVLAIKGQIHKGNSGSPVFNNDGRVIAVVFATLLSQEETSDEEIIGLAVPVPLILDKIAGTGLLNN
ncbi:MAG: S1C family serine protease [Peptococcaceae bacterium]